MKLSRPVDARKLGDVDLKPSTVDKIERDLARPWRDSEEKRDFDISDEEQAGAALQAYRQLGWSVDYKPYSDQRDGCYYRLTFYRPKTL